MTSPACVLCVYVCRRMRVYECECNTAGEERTRKTGGGGAGSDEVTQSVAHAWSYGTRYADKGARAASQMGVRVAVGGHNW